VSKKHSKSAAVVTNNGPTNTSHGGGGGDTNDTNPELKRVFWGIAYMPDWALPQFGCNITQSQVTRDISLLAQITPRIRLYSGECNQTAMVFEAIQQTKADLIIYAALDLDAGTATINVTGNADYISQREAVFSAFHTYGVDRVAGLTVGNEYMLDYLTDNAGTDPNSAAGNQGATILIAYIDDARTQLANLKLNKNIPVGNGDAGYFFNTNVLKAVDYAMANVHAWFASTTIQEAAPWVFQYYNQTDVIPAAQLPNHPQMYNGETGWPTASSDLTSATDGGGAAASVANLQIFIDGWVCQANALGIGYFFFEFIDEQWKEYTFGGVEGHWGLFDKDYNFKNLTLPDCISS